MRRVQQIQTAMGVPVLGCLLAGALLSGNPAGAQVTGLEANVIVLEKAAQSACPSCTPGDPRLLLPKAAAAIRIDVNESDDALTVQVIPLKASDLKVAELKVDGVDAELGEGAWQVPRSKVKKAPKIEMVLDDGQALSFKPQHRPNQGPVGGLILPKKEDQPRQNLSFHKKSFWADSLGRG
ncbi:MAG: hypothetical protein AAF657_38405 [Acidobacteriota bacterium]